MGCRGLDGRDSVEGNQGEESVGALFSRIHPYDHTSQWAGTWALGPDHLDPNYSSAHF